MRLQGIVRQEVRDEKTRLDNRPFLAELINSPLVTDGLLTLSAFIASYAKTGLGATHVLSYQVRQAAEEGKLEILPENSNLEPSHVNIAD